MKKALSISIGSSVRDKSVTVNLLGEDVHIQRISTDGDMTAARKMYRDFDGKVDSFKVGGTDLCLLAAIGYKQKVDFRNHIDYFKMTANLVASSNCRPQLQVLN